MPLQRILESKSKSPYLQNTVAEIFQEKLKCDIYIYIYIHVYIYIYIYKDRE